MGFGQMGGFHVRQSNRLTARTVATLKAPGRHADGGNLYLSISKAGGRRWTFFYQINSRQREAGLGSVSAVTLAEARARAAEYRSMLARGIDPLQEKQASKEAAAARRTFGQCADELIKSKRTEWRNAVHAGQWRSTIDRYCAPILDMPVDAVDTVQVLRCLQPIWNRVPETATRVRGRIEAVLDFAKARGWRNGENAAQWRGHLAHLLPKRPKLSKAHQPALPYPEVPEFVATLRTKTGIPALALEFTILCATRTGETVGARWDEIDFEAGVWTIPPTRTKSGAQHRVPLPNRAVEILEFMNGIRRNELVFAVGDSSMRKLCGHGFSVHGFRSSFRDWAGEETPFPREICETALGHQSGSEVERAYRRGDSLEKRRELMQLWADFCEGRA
jgi:integrase